MNAAVILSKIHSKDPQATPLGVSDDKTFFVLKSKFAPQTIRRALGRKYKVNFMGFGHIDARNIYRIQESTPTK